MALKTISPERWAEIDEQTKKDMEAMAKQLRGCRDNVFMFKRMLFSCMDYMYNLGLAAGMGGEVVEEGRCVNIERGSKYEITCPYCGETYDIDMEGMLRHEAPSNQESFGGYAIKV